MKRNETKIIPLGQNCIPRTILTRWKIKKRKILGELTYPFDLAVYGMPEITKCLRTNFTEFFYNLHYQNNCWIKAPNCIYFTHDTKFKEKDREKFINQYKNRIKNFQNEVNNSKDILFVQLLGEDEDIINQYKEIKRLRGEKPFKLAIIDTQNIVQNINVENIYILKLPFPNQDYKNNWWKKEYYNSEIGKNFEKQIADFCLEVLDKNL